MPSLELVKYTAWHFNQSPDSSHTNGKACIDQWFSGGFHSEHSSFRWKNMVIPPDHGHLAALRALDNFLVYSQDRQVEFYRVWTRRFSAESWAFIFQGSLALYLISPLSSIHQLQMLVRCAMLSFQNWQYIKLLHYTVPLLNNFYTWLKTWVVVKVEDSIYCWREVDSKDSFQFKDAYYLILILTNNYLSRCSLGRIKWY